MLKKVAVLGLCKRHFTLGHPQRSLRPGSPNAVLDMTVHIPACMLQVSLNDGSLLLHTFPRSTYRMNKERIMDGLNECRTARVAELLADFRALQFYIISAPSEPTNPEDYYTDGWVALRQCAADGQHILECAADTRVPEASGGELEQAKAELIQVLLDAFSRRHECHKIYMRQGAVQRWMQAREMALQRRGPPPTTQAILAACDQRLGSEIGAITDEAIYAEMATSDANLGRWTAEDPSLPQVLLWLSSRHR